MPSPSTIVIIGAGIAGLAAARELQSAGRSVILLDKGRGPGGRLATRRIGNQRFDHGAQYISAQSPEFQALLHECVAAGAAAPWFNLDNQPRYRGADGMTSIAKHLAAGLDLRLSAKATAITHRDNSWHITLESAEPLSASALLLTAPVPQSLDLLGPLAAPLLEPLGSIEYAPCFALMAALDGPAALPAEGFLRPSSGPLLWIADNTQKGITTGAPALTLHASPEFTRDHYDHPPAEVAALLLAAAQPWLGAAPVREWQLHRWRFSLVTQPGPEPCFFTTQPGPLAFAGDAFGPPRVEGAFLSGLAAARALLAL